MGAVGEGVANFQIIAAALSYDKLSLFNNHNNNNTHTRMGNKIGSILKQGRNASATVVLCLRIRYRKKSLRATWIYTCQTELDAAKLQCSFDNLLCFVIVYNSRKC